MNTGDTLIRDADKREFRVVILSHWSLIRANNLEEAAVKWIGGNAFISHDGIRFTLKESAP